MRRKKISEPPVYEEGKNDTTLDPPPNDRSMPLILTGLCGPYFVCTMYCTIRIVRLSKIYFAQILMLSKKIPFSLFIFFTTLTFFISYIPTAMICFIYFFSSVSYSLSFAPPFHPLSIARPSLLPPLSLPPPPPRPLQWQKLP